jgi:3-oxoacyl-[acyl-carrier-protein] synthase-3
MQANDLNKGVLFTADPYSKVIDPKDKDTSLLFGDAATATLLGPDPVWNLGKFLFGTRGAESDAIRVDSGDGLLRMNGRGVYTFSATTMPSSIAEMLAKNELDLGEVDCFVLHQGSRFIIETLRKRLGVDEDKVPFESADYGNTVSSSIPMILEDITDRGIVVIAGFGVGLSWGSTVLLNSSLEN